MIEPALALPEFSSIAAGIQATDAMVKRAPIDVIKVGIDMSVVKRWWL